MKTEELEEILNGGAETQRIEFKSACDWNVVSLAKDILALSNVQDGGYIVIGVTNGGFQREGVSEQQKNTYDIDTMRDQMTSYADPHVNFGVSYPVDSNGMTFVVIRVMEFETIPVICRRDSTETRAGILYYRNSNRRVESAGVSNSHDMRDITSRAAVKLMRQLQGYGLSAGTELQDQLEAELEGL